MPPHEDLSSRIEQLAAQLTNTIDSPKTRAIDGTIGAIALLQCMQLQRLAHTLHRIDGSLEALLKEVRNATHRPDPGGIGRAILRD